MNRLNGKTTHFHLLESINSNILPIENQEQETKHVLEFWYGIEMEEEDERRNLCGCREGNGHATWRMNGSKMSEECCHLRVPKTHKIRLGEGEQVSQKPTQF